jgi:hypothetical protein
MRRSAILAAVVSAAWGEVSLTVSAAQVASVLPDPTRPPSGRGLRIQPQVRQDLLDHRPLEDGRDDLELPGAAVRAPFYVGLRAVGPPLPRLRAVLNGSHTSPGAALVEGCFRTHCLRRARQREET